MTAVRTTTLRAGATAGEPALILRPWERRDADALIEIYRDPVLRRQTRVPVAGAEDAARWVDVHERGWATGDRVSFAVFEEAGAAAAAAAAEKDSGSGPASGSGSGEGRLVGHVVLKRDDPAAPTAEVGYWTAATARGHGVAPRALEALTTWAFETFDGAGGVDRLELLHQVDNPASCRVAEKTGYAFEALLPAAPPSYPVDGHLHVRRSHR
jgi:RimJ/RimL family protein N-acetyltransferase